jgi:CheY-like chemotaxis protein
MTASPTEGQSLARRLRPNLLITDIGFVGTRSGIELIDAIKQDAATADIPVIVLSGTPVEDLPAHTRRDAALVLLKPVMPDVLLAGARQVIADSAASGRTR